MAEAGEYVPPTEGHKHGFIGRVPDETPNEAYTVAGVTGATATVDDTSKPAAKPTTSKSSSTSK